MAIEQKVISGNDINQGNAIATVNKSGTIQSLDKTGTTPDDLTQLNALYNDRFDNIPYYNEVP